MTERWLPIAGYEGAYEISDLGRVRSLITGSSQGRVVRATPKVLTSFPNREGYHIVALRRGGRRKGERVHVQVLLAFVGPRPNGLQAAHGNDDKDNNSLSNLRWATPKQNSEDKTKNGRNANGERNGHAKLTEADVRYIRANPHLPQTALAERFGVYHTAIGYVRRGVTWKHVR